MKKLFAIVLFTGFIHLAWADGATDQPGKKNPVELTEEQKATLLALETRIAEIQAMDFSELSKEEKREVKAELREMKAQAKKLSGGLYISAGALIIILLLIILL